MPSHTVNNYNHNIDHNVNHNIPYNPPAHAALPTPATAPSASFGYFCGAPCTKLFFLLMIGSHVMLRRRSNSNQGTLSPWFPTLALMPTLSTKLTFPTLPELLSGGLLWLYWSRKFEREMGSQKYCIFVCWIFLATLSLEHILSRQGTITTMGPYFWIAALGWLYHVYTPRLYPRFFSTAGWFCSEKSFLYAWWLQVIISSLKQSVYQQPSDLLKGSYSTLFGILASWLFTRLQSTSLVSFSSLIPSPLLNLITQLSYRLLESPPRILVPQLPATAAIAAAAAAQAAGHRRMPLRQDAAAVPRHAALDTNIPARSTTADPAAIEQLLMMGFDRAQVVQALQSCNNDIQRAADRLLTQAGVL